MSEMDEIVREFLVESAEGLDQLDRDLVALEQAPGDRERLAGVFRCVHTIKGTCGFLGFTVLESVAHVGENLLVRLRDGDLSLDTPIANALLQLVDAIREILARIEVTGSDAGGGDYADLIATLTDLHQADADPSAVAGRDGAPVGVAEVRTQAQESSVRVDVGQLDGLMNLVGELVLARNEILQIGALREDPGLIEAGQRLDLITSGLQERVMKTRMQPIGNLWGKLPRLVRDLAGGCGKLVQVELHGADTELDRTVLEAVRDPLTHLVRNAVDHGLERPHERLASGKPAEGLLTLRAYHEGGQVHLEISDDGSGIPTEKVRRKAVERGVVSAEAAARMDDREVMQLVFLPGFSTAEQVTNVSGRGVGMDVVRSNVERIGGAIDVLSRPGAGTTFTLKIPLTLAIVPALVVTSGGDRYAIPQVSLVELVRLDGERAAAAVERLHEAPVYRLRGRLLPLVFLDRTLGTAGGDGPSGPLHLVVLRADDRQFGLVVDAMNDTQEIVVKPLGPLVQGGDLYAGATVMGDGSVALILDVVGLAQHARVLPKSRERVLLRPVTDAVEAPVRRESLLVFGGADGGRMAMPLSLVARLEKVSRDRVERIGGQDVIQYRGEILPLVHVAEAVPERRRRPRAAPPPGSEAEPLTVVIYGRAGLRVGLVVGLIHDIVEEALAAERPGGREGILRTVVVQGKVTEVVDLDWVLARAELLGPVEVPA